ncbi:MAG: OmpA family protein [Saprospiraceae bacterium]
MRKLIPSLILCLSFLTYTSAQSSGYVVQVAAFDTYVKTDYFKGLSGIYHVEDHNNIHKYYISGFADEAAASKKAAEAVNLGYNARVIDMDKIRNACSLSCGMGYDPSKVRSIFFDFDRYNLRAESNRQLNNLYEMLRANSKYSVELSAHTDAKGSNEYNQQLSMNRAKAAQTYLINKGLSASRIKISTFGESDPIAKNEVNGQDTPAGRQYNRRVELRVFDNTGTVNEAVEDIDVPDSLKN